MFDFAKSLLTPDQLLAGLRAVLLLVVGLILARIVSRLALKLLAGRLEAQQRLLLRRFLYYGISGLFVVASLHQLGFNLSVLLGAAGVLSVAVGFASQTSASNLISGLFLIGEKPFAIGDVIKINDTTGEVLAIDLLSVKLRTFDNRFVRIPNEDVIKSEVATLTKFPIRRVDVKVGVAYREDLEHVRKVLERVADRNLLCLDEPKPLFIVQGFGDSSIELQFSVWATQQNYLPLKNAIQLEIKRAFDDEGIEIPFPQRTIHAAPGAGPLPVENALGEPDKSKEPGSSELQGDSTP